MDNALWDKIVAFPFDEPDNGYGFSLRLSEENGWTTAFAEGTLLEYRKFMYLAATSEEMVSPSEIVDAVWHQHLIYTKSYACFCQLIGKDVHHVPSSNTEADRQKLQRAAARTKYQYQAAFGNQPEAYWQKGSMLDGLEMPMATMTEKDVLIRVTIASVVLLPVFYFLLRPVLIHINNPYFLYGLLLLFGVVIGFSWLYSRYIFIGKFFSVDKKSFLFQLTPAEAICLKYNDPQVVAYWTISRMIEQEQLRVNEESFLEQGDAFQVTDAGTSILEDLFMEYKDLDPAYLAAKLTKSKYIISIYQSTNTIKEHLLASRLFQNILWITYISLALVFQLGFVRVLLGMMRGKPVIFLLGVILLITLISRRYIMVLKDAATRQLLPKLYTKMLKSDGVGEGEWDYFFIG